MSHHIASRRLAVRGLVLVLAAAAVTVLPAVPASAAVPGLVRIAAVSATNSTDFRSVTATCPVGKRLIGTGYEINGAFGEVVVDDLRPNGSTVAAPTAVTVGAYEADPFAGNWNVTAYAICANPLPGLVRVTAVSATDSNDFHSATAACPTGKVLTGTGFELTGITGDGVVDDLRPNGGPASAPNAVTVGAYEVDTFLSSWNTRAYAICANPVAGLARITTVSALNSTDSRFSTATCPAGKVLTGSGFEVTGALGEVVVDDFRPNGSTITAPTAVTSGAYEEDPFAGNWQLRSYAICATR
ncbi:hypothetical protein SAMN05443287_10465 [Micromonospora phaseoli]|uniref:Uncharacterized protein n=1 Tax=Micromonospora phaseoli TaxID=1144548 RepID=A0A1H6YBS9_9ACTN|nr:hypothetical protein [Micromonospora phaseoli]PZW00038.1 hypothetical protein CLV64_10364 [Micromonospora phaseoli]GIJ80422.1 hypothetical protein Xph01_48540 [Micromonospora phaseoli]SEJ36497.1 hypothetical protein SAMN05443287_10465 [Micromonospora phaseoli]